MAVSRACGICAPARARACGLRAGWEVAVKRAGRAGWQSLRGQLEDKWVAVSRGCSCGGCSTRPAHGYTAVGVCATARRRLCKQPPHPLDTDERQQKQQQTQQQQTTRQPHQTPTAQTGLCAVRDRRRRGTDGRRQQGRLRRRRLEGGHVRGGRRVRAAPRLPLQGDVGKGARGCVCVCARVLGRGWPPCQRRWVGGGVGTVLRLRVGVRPCGSWRPAFSRPCV